MNEDKSLKNFLIGVLVGIGSTLPGISGGIIAVVMGVYERLISAVSDLRNKWRQEFWFLAILGGGIVIGMGGAAIGLRLMIDRYEILLVCLFLGLIVGQIPDVWKLARESGGPGISGTAAAVLGFAVMLALVPFTDESTGMALGNDFWTVLVLVFCGFILAMSKVVPGLSGSAILIAIGLYSTIIVRVTDVDVFAIVALGIGFVLGLFIFAKIMDAVLKNHRMPATHLIFGLTIGCVPVIAYQASGSTESMYIPMVLAFAAGVLVSYLFSKYLGSENGESA